MRTWSKDEIRLGDRTREKPKFYWLVTDARAAEKWERGRSIGHESRSNHPDDAETGLRHIAGRQVHRGRFKTLVPEHGNHPITGIAGITRLENLRKAGGEERFT